MQKLSGLRGLEGFRSLAGSNPTAMKAANPKPVSDAGGSTYGSFANLKMTAEKLVKEQASVKTDLEMAHAKLRRATEQINILEGKLQQAVNENAKLKVKQTEDSKLWRGLDSKISSTKTLCDQLTETLQQLASQTERAEEDKKCFEEKLENNSTALDEFDCLLHDLSAKLECAEQKIISGKQQMLQMKHEKEEMDQGYKERLCANDTIIKGKDCLIKQLEGSVDEYKARLICVDSRLQSMEQELKLKYDACISLKEDLASAESDNDKLELRNQECSLEIAKLCKNNKDLNDLLGSFVARVTELDKDHDSISSHVSRLLSLFERFQEMVQEEKMLIERRSTNKFEDLQNKYAELMSENNGLTIEIEELKSRIIELQKTQEIVMVQHVEECQVAEDKIRRLESEAEIAASNINQLEKLVSELQGRIQKLLEDSTLGQNHQQELLEKISKLESDNQDLVSQVQSIMDEKSKSAESLQGEIAKRDQLVDTLENQVNQIRVLLDEKEQLYSRSVEREKTLEEQKLQVEASLAATECQLIEAKKQYDIMLEGKQIELSRHLVELSLKNDQAINVIRKKYEQEKIEIMNAEKQKAENLIMEIENKCNEKISENKKDSEGYLMHLKEEHGSMVARIQQDNEHKESTLRAYHKEELLRIQSQAENELRERLSQLRKEHELHIQSLQMQHEGECQRLQEELELQKSKEEKQRALLQLQWKVIGEDEQVDQEVNSKKEYSVSSMRKRGPYGRNEHKLQLVNPEAKRKDVNLSGVLPSPISSMMRKIRRCQAYDISRGRIKNIWSPNTVMFGVPTPNKRPLHSTSGGNLERLKEKSISRNTALVLLDDYNIPASKRSFRRAIHKVRDWCRANGTFKDLSKFLGSEVYTTPPIGTFHLTYVKLQRKHKRAPVSEKRLTIFLQGSNLYIRGWKSARGIFEIQHKLQNYIYIPDPSCMRLKIGTNYYDYRAQGNISGIRIGLSGLTDHFDALEKCDGLISNAVLAAIAGFAINGPEAIHFFDVEEEVMEA